MEYNELQDGYPFSIHPKDSYAYTNAPFVDFLHIQTESTTH